MKREVVVSLLLVVAFVICSNYSFAECKDKEKCPEGRDVNQPFNSCNEFTFNALGSYDSNDENLSYLWDFGDGQTSTEPVVLHKFEKRGVYTVQLTVTDNSTSDCDTAVTAQTINVNIPPEADFSASDTICLKETVAFDAGSSHSPHAKELTYRWDFGDGTQMEGKEVLKSFSAAKSYPVTLIVDDASGTECALDTIQKTIKVNGPPVAKAGRDIKLQCWEEELKVTFNAAKSKDPNGDELNYFWDFGDGTTGEGKIVKHTYKRGGKYKVLLMVKDDSGLKCNMDMDTILVTLSRAPKANAGEDLHVCLGESVDFDGNKSFIEDPGHLFSRWDFGDGVSRRGLNVIHSYKNPGRYTATLTVENAFSMSCPKSTDTRIVDVNSPPIIQLDAKRTACVGNEVAFDASGSRDPNKDSLEYFWNFGDGTILQAGSRVTHKYEKGGRYKVTVIADDSKETSCSSASASIDVKVNSSPKADPGPNTVCCANKIAKFDGSASTDADGDELTYKWDFGDGSMAYEAISEYSYSKGGEYTVTLTVNDNTGAECSTDTAEFKVNVNEKPVPVIQIQ